MITTNFLIMTLFYSFCTPLFTYQPLKKIKINLKIRQLFNFLIGLSLKFFRSTFNFSWPLSIFAKPPFLLNQAHQKRSRKHSLSKIKNQPHHTHSLYTLYNPSLIKIKYNSLLKRLQSYLRGCGYLIFLKILQNDKI